MIGHAKPQRPLLNPNPRHVLRKEALYGDGEAFTVPASSPRNLEPGAVHGRFEIDSNGIVTLMRDEQTIRILGHIGCLKRDHGNAVEIAALEWWRKQC